MIRSILVISLLLFTSCSLFQKNEDYAQVMQSYLSPTEGREEELSSETIKKAITKEDSMAGGNYKLKLVPLSDRLVKAYYKELVFKNGLNENEQEKLWHKLSKEYLENKTCVHFEYQVIKFKKAKDLESWKLQFVDREKQTYPIKWMEKPLFSMPALTKIQRSGNLLEQWLYEGTGCADNDIPLENEFAVRVTPAFVQWPFPDSTDIWWEFDRTEAKEDGSETVIKKKKRSFQKYRGW